VDRVLARLGRTEKDSKNDGSFVFAISLIVASLTVLYRVYLYLNNNPIESTIYILILYLAIILMVMILSSMGFFIILKAISLEVNDPKIKEKVESFATNCYLIGFLIGSTYLVMMGIFYVTGAMLDIFYLFICIPKTSYISIIVESLIIFIISAFGFGIFHHKIRTEFKEILESINGSIFKIILLLSIPVCFGSLLYLPSGNIIVEMDDIYNNQSEQIPISIIITGLQYDDVIVNLSKVDIKNNLILIDSINIKNELDPSKVVSSKYIIGNALDLGQI